MWSVINQALNAVFDIWLWPFQALPVLWQIAVLAFPATIFSLLVFRFFSNQEGIRNAKNKIKAHLLELRLFKDDLHVTLMAQRSIFRYTLTYMRHALLPMAVMLIPFVLILVQVESRYAFRGLNTDESAVISITLDIEEPVSQLPGIITLPQGLVQDTAALRIDSSGEILWRIHGDDAGDFQVAFDVADHSLVKRVVIDPDQTHLAQTVYRADDIRSLGFPAEPSLTADQPVSSVSIGYPRARAEFAGLSSASWWLFLFTLILGFALRGVMGVTF